MNAFFRGVEEARFPRLENRDDLWKLLVVITARKVAALRRRLGAQKSPDLHQVELPADDEADLLHAALGDEPTPETTAIFADELDHRLAQLPDDTFRQIVLLKLEGCTNREIAERLKTYEVKIERKLRTIRSLWNERET